MTTNMRKFLAVGVLLGASSTAWGQVEPTAQSKASSGKIANHYICVFGNNVNPHNVKSEAERAANPELGKILHIYKNTIRGFAVRLPAMPDGPGKAMGKLKRNNPKISYCEQDGISRAAVLQRGKPGGGGSSQQSTPWGVARVGGSGDGTGRTAWIIDSGIDLDHPDLNVDLSRARSFLSNDSSADDANGHGTHVAGIVAALNNSFGVVGVAPNASLVPLRVLDAAGAGPDSGVIAAIEHVATNAVGGDVANLSLVADAKMQSMNDAVQAAAAKGIRFTIAAGNSGADANDYSPGSAEGANIYTVSSFGSRDVWSRFSNWGTPLDYAEPGESILSTYKNGGYSTLSGTSMAAPHLAGILLITTARTVSTVKRDPDGNPDPIGER